ncbi:hypothetical protein [Streptomyces sp. NPDC052610]|uniref:hypothetical protein n=1 Tax=Streptomyces sp. NPDC052610 TaxID=3154952 RepID=UPI003419654E
MFAFLLLGSVLAIVGARDGVIPRASVVQRYRGTDPRRLARDTLRISWYGKPIPYLPS